MDGFPPMLTLVTIGCAGVAAALLVRHLVKRPTLDLPNKLMLLLALGVLPAAAAAASSATGMQATTEREFCGSCHVMGAHAENAADPNAQSLAARHSRNPFFGERSCYVCHADYGMYGYALTKAGGMGHVYEYYLNGYSSMSLEDAKVKIHIKKPYDNKNCRQCHTTSVQDWRSVPDHNSLAEELAENKVSCASAGCHGFAHPFTKVARGIPTALPSASSAPPPREPQSPAPSSSAQAPSSSAQAPAGEPAP